MNEEVSNKYLKERLIERTNALKEENDFFP